MARALIVGCDCRGRYLGRGLLEAGWQVRGTTREPSKLDAIEAEGIEGAVADPDRIGELLDHLDGVSLIFWLLASATGDADRIGALHGPRLGRLLEEIVDTPVRGFVYEMSRELDPGHMATALQALRSAGERWRIPFEVVDAAGMDEPTWRDGMLAAARELIG